MNSKTKEVLEAIGVYAEMLNNINKLFRNLIKQNSEKQLHENEQMFYEIISEILRVFPVVKKEGKIKKLDTSSGILLLSEDIPFLENEYQKIIDNETCRKVLLDMVDIRNKFIHEPHNMHVGFYVGGKTSCSMGIYYRDTLCSISTIKISFVICELNKVFEKLKVYFMEIINACDEKYKEYPCYKAVINYSFEKHNVDYPTVPIWMLDDEAEIN